MVNLVDFLTEGNISNTERKYREFCQMCTGYNVAVEEVSVHQTARGNWAVCKGEKRVFTASSNILDEEVVAKYNIKKCEC